MPPASLGFRVNMSGETYAKANCIRYIAFHPRQNTGLPHLSMLEEVRRSVNCASAIDMKRTDAARFPSRSRAVREACRNGSIGFTVTHIREAT
jgi:hypothetical protein